VFNPQQLQEMVATAQEQALLVVVRVAPVVALRINRLQPRFRAVDRFRFLIHPAVEVPEQLVCSLKTPVGWVEKEVAVLLDLEVQVAKAASPV
jgi:hypothetical protein